MTKFRTKFTLLDIKPPSRLCRVRTEENIAAVSAVLMLTINYRFVAVCSNLASVAQQRGTFCDRFLQTWTFFKGGI